MRVAITEGPDLLVDALRAALVARGDAVVLLTRAPRPSEAIPEDGVTDRRWDPGSATIARPGLDDVDAVFNLFGSSAVRRWTAAAREDLRASRLTGTLTVVSALDPDGRCQRLLTLSSTAFYGDTGSEVVGFDTPRGPGFLARTVADWEGAASHAPVPTALLRTPPVLASAGGYLGDRSGWLAGRLGTGRQYLSWIHVQDWAAACLVLLDHGQEGPVNVVAPDPVTEARFVAERARAAGGRPPFGVPDAVLSARFGAEAARELWQTSTRAMPFILLDLGFQHRFGTLPAALADVVPPRDGRP